MPLKNMIPNILAAVLFLQVSAYACAQQSDPGDFISLLTTARQHSTDQKWKEAVDVWEQVVERNPVNGEYIANLAFVYYNTAQYAKSINAYKKQI